MRLEQAKQIIEGSLKAKGYRVSYEHSDGRFVTYSCFPAHHTVPAEPPFATESEAWAWAHAFANTAPASYRNIKVVDSSAFKEVSEKILRFHP